MARPTSHPKGAPCWVDLMSSDPARAREFYAALFGWTAEEPNAEFGGYFNFSKDGIRIAGAMGKMPGQENIPDSWSVHLSTPDARRTVEDARAHGAEVIVDAMDVGDLGTMSVIRDPSGAAVGAWQSGRHTGFGIAYENDAPAWFELHTRDYATAIQFYRDVFDWQTVTASDTPELRYTVLQLGDTQLAGIMDDTGHSDASVPSHWLVYFGVADADGAAAKVKELGGSIIMPPQDTPYGRIGVVADPTGAVFSLVQNTSASAAEATADPATANAAS